MTQETKCHPNISFHSSKLGLYDSCIIFAALLLAKATWETIVSGWNLSICLGYSGSHTSDGVNVQYNKNKTTLSCTRGKTFLFQFVARKYSRGDTKQREILGLQKSFFSSLQMWAPKKLCWGPAWEFRQRSFCAFSSQRRLTNETC